MRVPPILVLFGLVAVNLLNMTRGLVSAAQVKSEPSALHTQIQTLLRTSFPRWRPKQLSDMESDDQQLWLNGPNGKKSPGIAVGHFEAVDELSYAVLLVPKSDPSGGHKIVVVSRESKQAAYACKLLDHAEGQTYSGLVISKAGPGKYSDVQSRKSVQLGLDSVYVEWIEKGALIYYWSESRYRKLLVSD